MNVGTLTIELAANMARLSRDLSAAQKSVEGTMAQIRASAESAMSALGRIGVGLSFAGLSAFVKTAIDAADEMNKLSQRIGVAVEDLAGMQLAFRQGGIDAEKFSTSMAKLAAGIADGKESLAAMGIETRKADGSFKSTRQIIVEVANKFATYRDGVEKTALAIDLFGRSGAELIPTLNAGGASLDEFDKIARKLGLTLDKETTEAAERFNDKMELIGLASRGLANQVMSELLPSLEALADYLLDAKMKGDGLANTAKMIAAPMRVIIETISVLAVEAVYLFKTIGNEIGGIMAQISLGPAALHPLSKEAEAFKRIREMMIADGEAARKEYEAAIARIMNAGKDLTAQAEKAAAASNSISRGAAPQMAKALKDLDNAFESQRITATAWSKAMQDAQSRLDKAAAQTDGLSDSQAALRDYLRDNYEQVQKINPEMNVMVVNLYKAAIATEQAKDATDKYKKLLAGAEEASKKYTDALQKNVDTVQEQIKDLQKEEEAIKIAKDSRISLAEAIQQVEIARLREKQAIESESGAGEQNIEIIEREIAAREQLAQLLASKEAREANARAAKEAADQWKSVTMDIERALTDALVRGFENGKSFFKSLGNYLVNFFKTTLARAIAQSIMTGVGLGTSGLAGASFGGGGATEPGSLGNILGLGNIVSALSNVYNTVIGGFTNLGNTVAFAAQDIGAWLVTNTSGVLNSAGSTLMSTATTLGTVASYVGGMAAGLGLGRMISGRFEAFGNGNIATVGGTIIGAIIGGPIGAAIGGAIGGLINRAFGRGPEQVTGASLTGTFGAGGANITQLTNTLQEGGWFRSDRRREYEQAISAELQVLLDTALRATADVVTRYATVLGLPVDAIAGFTQAINIDIKDKTPEEIEKAIADALSGFGDAMITSLFPEITEFIRANETAGEAFTRLANHLVGVNQVLGTLNLQLMEASLFGADAASSLIDLFGGEENFLTATSQYYEMFYSEAERTAKLTEQLQQAFAALGIEMPNTREQFRAIVESLDLTTESGQRTFAALMTLAPSFNAVASASERAAEEQNRIIQELLDAAGIAAENQARAVQEMLSSAGINASALSDIIRDGLLGRLSQEDVGAQITGMIVGGVYNALASTYASQITQLMMDGIITPMVVAASTGASISAVVSQQSIDVMIAQVNAVTAAFAEILKNPALLEAIRNLGTTISSALGGIGTVGEPYIPPPPPPRPRPDDFDGGMRQPESADKWIAEREQLERRLLTLQGNTVELRRRELEALDPVNRALQQQIWALEDQQRIQQERFGLETQLLTLQGNTAELRRRELEALDPANRALQQQIWALEDAARAAEEVRQAEQRRTQERLSLEQRLLTLQGDVTELRRRELAALDPANRALQELIWSLEDAAAAAAEQQRIASERESLETRLLTLQGNTAELRRRELEKLDPANRALQQRIWELEDAAEAERAAAQAAAEARRAAEESARAAEAERQRILNERLSLEQRLLTLQGNTTELRRRELLGLDASNRALQEQIWALEDAAAAARAAAEAEQKRMNERLSLEQRLLTLQGDTAELRRRELEALDPTNRALQEQIWALEEQQAAEEKARTAMDEFVASLKGVTDSLDEEVRKIRGLFYTPDAASLAAIQSEFAIATAAARSGDLEAARRLPDLAQRMLEMGAGQANSLTDVLRLRGATASSLEETSRIVSSLTPYDQTQPQQIAPNGTLINQSATTAAGQETISSELRQLREEMRAQAAASVQLQTRVTRILERWDGDGLPEERVIA